MGRPRRSWLTILDIRAVFCGTPRPPLPCPNWILCRGPCDPAASSAAGKGGAPRTAGRQAAAATAPRRRLAATTRLRGGGSGARRRRCSAATEVLGGGVLGGGVDSGDVLSGGVLDCGGVLGGGVLGGSVLGAAAVRRPWRRCARVWRAGDAHGVARPAAALFVLKFRSPGSFRAPASQGLPAAPRPGSNEFQGRAG